jgi:hypothetical protein|tara:strand:- start:26 stop:394 length:369 start_codon:yes stop_codon:yes gene_type:complete
MGNPQKYYVKASYDYSSDGATAGAQTLAVTDNIPKGATVVEIIVEKTEAMTSGGSATLTLTGGGVNISPAYTIANLTGTGFMPLGTAPNTPITATSNAAIGVTIATATLTAGKFNFTVGYLL